MANRQMLHALVRSVNMNYPPIPPYSLNFNLDAESAYKCFIEALKQDSAFAPAFTSLGTYYNDILSPPDPIRASKCFQKAFELDAREAVAARQLVEGFANDAEWDLVEVVAQRTIDGEGGVTGGLDNSELDLTSRYLPTNSWAWKAIGVVKFVSGFWTTFSLTNVEIPAL
jgi:superkiller protein 3